MSERSTARYETAVATFVGVLALVVSAYTAYVQRQQVRAQVLPILQASTSNLPQLMVSIDNKGVGPAIIKHVVVTVDGEPMRDWTAVLQKLMGPGQHPFVQNDVGSLILSPNETVNALKLIDDGDCWMLKASARGQSLDQVRRCPAPSARTFRE